MTILLLGVLLGAGLAVVKVTKTRTRRAQVSEGGAAVAHYDPTLPLRRSDPRDGSRDGARL